METAQAADYKADGRYQQHADCSPKSVSDRSPVEYNVGQIRDTANEIIASGGEVTASQNDCILAAGGPSFKGWGREAYVRALRKWLSEPAPEVKGQWEYIINLSGQFSILMPQDSNIVTVTGNRLIVTAGTGDKVYRHFVWYNKAVAGKLICKKGELYLWEVQK